VAERLPGIVTRTPDTGTRASDGQPLPYLDKNPLPFVPERLRPIRRDALWQCDIGQLFRGPDVPTAKSEAASLLGDPAQGALPLLLPTPRSHRSRTTQAAPGHQYAIDREAMRKAVAVASAPQQVTTSRRHLGYDPSVPFYSYDLPKAQALMKESRLTTPFNVA